LKLFFRNFFVAKNLLVQLPDKLDPAEATDPRGAKLWIDNNRELALMRQPHNGWLAQKTLDIKIGLQQQKAAMWQAAT